MSSDPTSFVFWGAPAPYPWEEGVASSKSLQTLFLYHTFPQNWELIAQAPRLKEVTLMGREGRLEERNTAAKLFSTLAPWCRIVVRDFSEDQNSWTIIEPTGPRPSTDTPLPAVAPFDEAQAKAHQAAWAEYLGVPVEYENSLGMKFRLIPPGEFVMGSTPEEIEAALKEVGDDMRWQEVIRSSGPQFEAILTQPFYLGVTEVTQSQFEHVIGSNPSHFSATGEGKDLVANMQTGNHPVEMVSWNDAAEFCAKLSQQEEMKPFYFRPEKKLSPEETITLLEGTGYRLPTEAEWEYACRAGTTTLFWNGDTDSGLITGDWYYINSGGRTHAVGELKANPFGLSDMHGNVWEWVQDSWDPEFHKKFAGNATVDPVSQSSLRAIRIHRGGNWYAHPSLCRSSRRLGIVPEARQMHLGFRVALPADTVKDSLQRKK